MLREGVGCVDRLECQQRRLESLDTLDLTSIRKHTIWSGIDAVSSRTLHQDCV